MNKATAKRNAMNATTKEEQQIAKRISTLPKGSEERNDLEDEVANVWVLELAEILEQEQQR